MVEITLNNAVNDSMRMSPAFADENHHPDDNLYRNFLAMGLWAVTRHGTVGTDFLVLVLVPEEIYHKFLNLSYCKLECTSQHQTDKKCCK